MGRCPHLAPVWLLAATAPAANIWPPRKKELLRHHPFYGRNLSQDDWPELSAVIERARTLPASRLFHVAVLIEGEEDVATKEIAFWQAGADVFQLTFKTVRADTLFFPNSMISEGRNYLFAAAAYVELQMGYRYSYYCFVEADTVHENWHVGWQKFESFLKEWEPAVGLPVLDGYSSTIDGYRKEDGAMVRSVMNFDHTIEAVHSDAAPWLLPYVLDGDTKCQWVSQWRFASLANALFPGHVLLTHSVEIENTAHGSYSKDYCMEGMLGATLDLREKMPEAASCFVEPRHEALAINGTLRLSAYLPWSRALRRRDADPTRQNYSSPEIAKVRTCEDEPTLHAMNQKSSYSWCRGCPDSLAYGMLQSIVAHRPFEFVGWLRLADFLALAVVSRDDLLIPQMCLSVAVRMLRCLSNIDGSHISWQELKNFRAAHLEWGLQIQPTEETVQEIERLALAPDKRDIIIKAVRLALMPQGDQIEPVSFMNHEKAESFVDWLLQCPAAGGVH